MERRVSGRLFFLSFFLSPSLSLSPLLSLSLSLSISLGHGGEGGDGDGGVAPKASAARRAGVALRAD